MSEQIIVEGNLVIARWHAFSPQGIKRLMGAVHSVAGTGVAPVYISLVGSDVGVPDAATRKQLIAATDEARRVCASICLVLDGSGVAFAAIRSIAAGMFLARGDRRMKMYNSLREALADRAGDRVDAVLAATAALAA